MNALNQLLKDQLNAIPSLNEYFNRLPCNTKDWIIEAVKQAFKEWLTQKRREREGNDFSKGRFEKLTFYDELLEELKK